MRWLAAAVVAVLLALPAFPSVFGSYAVTVFGGSPTWYSHVFAFVVPLVLRATPSSCLGTGYSPRWMRSRSSR